MKPNKPPKKKGCLLKFVILFILFSLIIKGCFFDLYKIPTGSMEKTLLVGDYIAVNKIAYKLATPSLIPFTDIKIPNMSLLKIKEPERNDIIVFDFPGQVNEFEPADPTNFVKRLIGKPGDTIEIKERKLYVNRKLIEAPLNAVFDSDAIPKGLKDPNLFSPGKSCNIDNYGPMVVPKKGDVIGINRQTVKYWGMIINREYGRMVVSTEGSVVTIEGTPVKNYTFRKNYFFVLGDNRENSLDSRYWGFVPEDALIGKAAFVYWSWDPYISIIHFTELYKSIKWRRMFKSIK
jgi:signal peptidase I